MLFSSCVPQLSVMRPPKSFCIAVSLFFTGGWWGLHHLYLENYAEALLYGHTLAGCGLLLLVDLCRLRALIADVPETAAPIQLARVAAQWFVSSWYAQVVSLPGTVFVSDVRDLSPVWLRVLCSVAIACAAAAGAALAGSCGSQRAPFMINAALTTAAVLVAPTVISACGLEWTEWTTPALASLCATAVAVLTRLPRDTAPILPTAPAQVRKNAACSEDEPHASGEAPSTDVSLPSSGTVESSAAMVADEARAAGGLRRRTAARAEGDGVAAAAPASKAAASLELPLRRRPSRRPLRRCALSCGVLVAQAAFWAFLVAGAALHVDIDLAAEREGDGGGDEGGGAAESFKLGELLWLHRGVLWEAAAAGLAEGGGAAARLLWDSPELQETWRAYQRRRAWERGRQQGQWQQWGAQWGGRGAHAFSFSFSGGWADPLRQWALLGGAGGEGSVGALLRELRLEPPGAGQGGGVVPSAATLRAAHRAAALELHPDRLPPGATAEERQAAAGAFERMQRAYERLLAMRRRQGGD